MDFIEFEFFQGSSSNQKVAEMKRVKGSPKKTNPRGQKMLLST